ncbi:insulinase family protein [Sphingomonas sp. MMS24-JH45]
MRAFHDRWYRPERVVVIISGDIDPDVAARLVVKNFGGWQGKGRTSPIPDFGKPDPKAPATKTVVEPALPPIVAMGVLRPWTFQEDTIVFNQKRLVDFLALRLINRRLETRARAAASSRRRSASTTCRAPPTAPSPTSCRSATIREAALKDVLSSPMRWRPRRARPRSTANWPNSRPRCATRSKPRGSRRAPSRPTRSRRSTSARRWRGRRPPTTSCSRRRRRGSSPPRRCSN